MPFAQRLGRMFSAHRLAAFGAFARPSRLGLRPACEADAEALRRFVDGLCSESRSMRFHGGLGSCSDAFAEDLALSDGVRQVVWLALQWDGRHESVIGECRIVAHPLDPQRAELAIAVADAWQGRHVSDALLSQVLRHARSLGVQHLHADVRQDNLRMQGFMQRHGFTVDPFVETGDGPLQWTKDIVGGRDWHLYRQWRLALRRTRMLRAAHVQALGRPAQINAPRQRDASSRAS